MTRHKALIAGATGMVGRRLAEYLAATGDWEVVGLARRPPAEARQGIRYVAVDLTDPKACKDKIGAVPGVTHILYAARYDHDSRQPEPIDTNTQMLQNVVEAVEAGGDSLQHIHVVQGTKYYGSNLGPFKTPAREDDPRSLKGNFYYDQEDYLIERQAQANWTWSASRPHGILDHGLGIARNMTMVIGVYAAISKEMGLPLCFPGTPESYRAVYQCTGAEHLAKAVAWMSTEPRCANQAFNITNGDYVRWCNLWPRSADYFDMPMGPVRTVRLADVMADKAPVWDRIVEKYKLRPAPFGSVALWPYGDFLFAPHWDIMSSTVKARQYGFADVVDTESHFIELFEHYRKERVLP
jgi:nucleoside-diphosphate-sugar epimerase